MEHEITYHALFCKPNIGNTGFCLKRYSAYDICPKYELEGIPDTWKDAMSLGRYMTGDAYIHTKTEMCLYALMYMTKCTCSLVIGSWRMLPWFATLCPSLACSPLLLSMLVILDCAPSRDWCSWIWLWHYFSLNFSSSRIHMHYSRARR